LFNYVPQDFLGVIFGCRFNLFFSEMGWSRQELTANYCKLMIANYFNDKLFAIIFDALILVILNGSWAAGKS
jgi:hypothetical protein